jgi:hypothetical protein
VRCATGWVGRHRSVEVVIPRSLTDVKQGYQGPSDERRKGRDPAHARRSRPCSIDVEGLWLENLFRSKRRPMSQVRCEFSAGHRTGGVNAEALWPPLDPELVRRDRYHGLLVMRMQDRRQRGVEIFGRLDRRTQHRPRTFKVQWSQMLRNG